MGGKAKFFWSELPTGNHGKIMRIASKTVREGGGVLFSSPPLFVVKYCSAGAEILRGWVLGFWASAVLLAKVFFWLDLCVWRVGETLSLKVVEDHYQVTVEVFFHSPLLAMTKYSSLVAGIFRGWVLSLCP